MDAGYLTVAVWTALFALGVLVLIVYRQLGRVFAPAGPRAELGPSVGVKANAFEYIRLSDRSSRSFVPGGGAALLAFVEPTCPTCEALVENLGRASRAHELSGLRVLLIISDPSDYVQVSDTFRSTHLELGRLTTPRAREEYRAFGTPLLVAIDAAGVVRGALPTTDTRDIRAFRELALSPSRAENLGVGVTTTDGQARTRPTETVTSIGGTRL
jgi:hypothetical protein